MKYRKFALLLALFISVSAMLPGANASADKTEYTQTVCPLERKGTALYLSQTVLSGTQPQKQILLVHGVTYSSHEFDIDYLDYSLVRYLARNGYGVWQLDIAGFGRSGEVGDGFAVDSAYAAEDIRAAAERIIRETGQDTIDLLGWSWGTVTTGRFAATHPEMIGRLVLYAPILCGIGAYEVTEPFHHNTWEHAADDFQRGPDGSFDTSVTEPEVIELFCLGCWHYDGESSPNGGRKDICVDPSNILIDLKQIRTPTLVICGDRDPYLDYDLVNRCLEDLPEGSALEIIPGGSHVVFLEAPCYHDFQERLLQFLLNETQADDPAA